RTLHERLIENPRAAVSTQDLARLEDDDARENYAGILRFGDELREAPTLEAFYFDLFRRDVAVPPAFVHQTAQVILRNILDGVERGVEARAAEIFFRPQSVTIERGTVMVADQETVEKHASSAGLGNIGRL